MDLELAGKVAVVTGANKGIGLATTKALLGEGAHVVAGSLSTENLDGLEGVSAVPLDLMAEDGPALLVQRAIDEHGRLDVLVNNVGAVRIRLDGFLATSDEEFEWAMRINFFTGLRASRAAISRMVEQSSGSASRALPKRLPRRPASMPTRFARAQHPRSPPGGSAHPRKSPP